MTPATPAQIADTASWLAETIFQYAFQVLPWSDRPKTQIPITFRDVYGERVNSTSSFIRNILSSSNFHHINLRQHDSESVAQSLKEIVTAKLDHLPKESSLEGLELMRDAWNEYDIAIMYAKRYKYTFKSLFGLQLFLTWLVVLGSALVKDLSLLDQIGIPKHYAVDAVFLLTVLASAMMTVESLVNAKQRWRILRDNAGAIESIIYHYRTRVGYFALDSNCSDPLRPEVELRNALSAWRDEIVAGADIATSNFRRIHPPSVYRHYQYTNMPKSQKRKSKKGAPPETNCIMDDFHSPLKPDQYINLRMEPSTNFFMQRIPVYTRLRICLKLLLLLLGVTTACLAYLEYVSWVVVVAGLSSAITSWMEFSDAARKVERYTRAVASLQNLHSWWKSLSEVQKASKENVCRLISTSESIIARERLAWISTANKNNETKAPAEVDSTATTGAAV